MEMLTSICDHTLLKPDTTTAQVTDLLKEAIEIRPYSVCINPCFVKYAYDYFNLHDPLNLDINQRVKICTVVGFPLGANTPHVKASEAVMAISDGADEIDMVLNIGKALEGDLNYLVNEISLVVNESKAKTPTVIVKVICESCLLSDDQVKLATKAAFNAKADFIKTSTGFSTGGATINAVSLMKSTIESSSKSIEHSHIMKIKASGGIRNLTAAKEMISAGASRLGVSATMAIYNEEISGYASNSAYNESAY